MRILRLAGKTLFWDCWMGNMKQSMDSDGLFGLEWAPPEATCVQERTVQQEKGILGLDIGATQTDCPPPPLLPAALCRPWPRRVA